MICDPWSRNIYKAVAVFPYHCKLRLVSYFTAIYLVLAILCLVQQGSTSSHFTWHLTGETSLHHPTMEIKFPTGIKWLSLLFSRRTNQHRPSETPAPAALANTSDAETNPYFYTSFLEPHPKSLHFPTIYSLPASP